MNMIMVVNSDMSKYSIITLEEVSSTNSYALEHIRFFDDKTIIFTLNQLSGRGRYNRKWISDTSGNIYMSLVLKPENPDSFPFSNLTQYLSLVVCKLLENEFNLTPEIKWPNDILVNSQKISGILAESFTIGNKISGIVLGLGLNVNLDQNTIDKIDQKATSLFVLKNKKYDPDIILKKLLDCFFENYDEFVKNGFLFIKKEYIQRCNFLGKNITIREAGAEKKYTAQSIKDNGLLIVKDEFNNEEEIITGDLLC